MCGIAGFTGEGKGRRDVLQAMVRSFAYRGPDDEGVHVDAAVALGYRRLAIIDPGGGAQPRVDAESGDALVFNGEIYGYKDQAKRLRAEGVPLRDESDTEVLFWLIRRNGVIGALERIDGMFAFAFRDGGTGTLWLARDRFGEKPLFYAVREGELVFASEVKAILHHPAFSAVGFDPVAVDQYLCFEYLPGTLTGYIGLRKLQPAHLLRFESGRATIEAYWRIDQRRARNGTIGESEALERLEALLDDSVQKRLIADVPVGVFLSGGVDSGLVAALAARHAPGITAYTVRMPESTYDETRYADMVARHHGLNHEIVHLTQADVVAACERIGELLDEPLADSSLIPTFLVCRAARRSLTVAIGGDGGDELFGGYRNFPLRRLAPVMARLPARLGAALRWFLARFPASDGYMRPDFVLRQLSQGFGAPADLQSFKWMAPFDDDERATLWRGEANPGSDPYAPVRRLIETCAAERPMSRLLHLFMRTYLAEDVLAKLDRASMYNSLEVRSPLLAREVAEFALSLPVSHKVGVLETKPLLKKLAARMNPRASVYRPKHGFAMPLSSLLRGPLFEPVSDVLLDEGNPLASWFRRDVIEAYLRQHRDGGRDHRKKIWALYILFRVAARPRQRAPTRTSEGSHHAGGGIGS